MENGLLRRLCEHLTPLAPTVSVADVRVGLGFIAVRLESGSVGLCWTPRSESSSCTHLSQAGTLAGRPAGELLQMLLDPTHALARAVGLATANAIAAQGPSPMSLGEDVLKLLDVTAADRVAMVGYFGPLVPRLRESRCHLDIIELEPGNPEAISPEEGRASLASCTVAIITATTLVNGTCDQVLSDLRRPRAAVLLGPSAPLCPSLFVGGPLTLISGARVRDTADVLRIVSEGGGTQRLRRHMEFVGMPVGSQVCRESGT